MSGQWERRIEIAVGTSACAFVATFLFATSAAIAVPGGWAAWRVGLLAGIVMFCVYAVISGIVLGVIAMDEA